MSAWAYECRARHDAAARWFVSRTAIDQLPPGIRHVLVHVGDDWVPAVVDRSQQVAVEAMLLRDVVADDEAPVPAADAGARIPAVRAIDAPSPAPRPPAAGRQVTAAAISMAGMKFVVVLVDLATASAPGDADLVIADLEPRFGVPVVLMGQEEDGTPVYYGADDLKDRVSVVPVDRMPWQQYTVN
jgi:hypothetical protein